jgi:hypothetical protein
MKILITAFAFYALWTFSSPAHKKNINVIQFDIAKILNARPVTTLRNGKLIPWAKGIDGNGLADGYLTMSAALFNGDKDPHALPDNPVFAANASHPEIKLHYSNSDSLNDQACAIAGAGEIEFRVPKEKYTDVYLALTSAEGPATLQVQYNYSDGNENRDFTVPDYYSDVKPNDPDICYLVHDLAKWGNKNNMTEKDHHNIDLLDIHPDPARLLKGVTVSKNKAAYLVLWAAAGVRAD